VYDDLEPKIILIYFKYKNSFICRRELEFHRRISYNTKIRIRLKNILFFVCASSLILLIFLLINAKCKPHLVLLFSFFFAVALQSLKDLGRLTYRRFLELFRHMIGLLGRVISPSQGLYLHRITQHRKTRTNIHALSGIRTHDPSNQPAKNHASNRTATVTGFTFCRFYNSKFTIKGLVLSTRKNGTVGCIFNNARGLHM
jgi:hypothetical protein